MPRSLVCSALFCVLAYSLPAAAETSLWRVAHQDRELFLAGAIHILRPTDHPLPEAFSRAYERADRLVFETDFQRLNSPEVQLQIMQLGLYPDGSTLKDALSPAVYRQLEAYAAEQGAPLALLTPMRPPLAFLTLLTLQLQQLGMDANGVDMHFFQRAQADRKPVEGLESVEQQLDFLFSMGGDDPDAFMRHALEELRDTENLFERMTAAWKNGDTAVLSQEFVTALKTDYPAIYQQLLARRNAAWMAPVQAHIESPGTELVVVGVAHLVGEDGLVRRLREAGYQVEQW